MSNIPPLQRYESDLHELMSSPKGGHHDPSSASPFQASGFDPHPSHPGVRKRGGGVIVQGQGQGEGRGGGGGNHTPGAAGARHGHGLPHHPAHAAAAATAASPATPGGVTAGSPTMPPRTLIAWPHQQGSAAGPDGDSSGGRGGGRSGGGGGGAMGAGPGGGLTGAGAHGDASGARSSSSSMGGGGGRRYGGAASDGSVQMEQNRLGMWGGDGRGSVRGGGGKASEEGWIARLAAMLVGEDPTQCYALICRSCHAHNGECFWLSWPE